MKVIVRFKDGSTREIPVPETEWSHATPAQAAVWAMKQLAVSERENVKTCEVEEDFL